MDRNIFHQILTHYNRQPSSIEVAKKFGVQPSTLHHWIYSKEVVPRKALQQLHELVPKLKTNLVSRIDRKIEKLEQYKKDLENKVISDQNQLQALILQYDKGKKIKREDEEFDLKYLRKAPTSRQPKPEDL